MCSLHVLTFSFLMVAIHEEYAAKPALKPTNTMYYSIKCIYFKS